MLQSVEECCSMLQGVREGCRVLQTVAFRLKALQRIESDVDCCRVSQCAAEC